MKAGKVKFPITGGKIEFPDKHLSTNQVWREAVGTLTQPPFNMDKLDAELAGNCIVCGLFGNKEEM